MCLLLCRSVITGGRPRAAKRVCPVLDFSIEEESVAEASSRTGEMSLSV